MGRGQSDIDRRGNRTDAFSGSPRSRRKVATLSEQEVIAALAERNPFIDWANHENDAYRRNQLARHLYSDEVRASGQDQVPATSPQSVVNNGRFGSPKCRAKVAQLTADEVCAALIQFNPFIDWPNHENDGYRRGQLATYLYSHAGEDIAGGLALDIDDT